MTEINELIQARYDAFVLAKGSAVATAETKDAIALEIALEIEKEDRDYLSEARLRIDSVIGGSRKVRRSHIKRNIETILAASFPEDLHYIDPLLDMAFPLGDSAGLDKALRFWTVEDFDSLLATVVRSASEVAAAAGELSVTVELVKAHMSRTRTAMFGDAVTRTEATA